jgi:hypothetical protein
MSGFSVDQGAGASSAAVLRSTREPGRQARYAVTKRIRKRKPGKSVAVWSRMIQSAPGQRACDVGS